MHSKKETILKQFKSTSVDISKRYDKLYSNQIQEIAEELSVSFNNLFSVINRKNQKEISDHNFQAALLFWSGANSIMSSIDIFRRGYPREPLIILRHALEIISTGYCAHQDPQISEKLLRSEKINSSKNISKAKKIQPIIGLMYGLLSNNISHISTLHIIPSGSKTSLPIGGIYDKEDQKNKPLVLSMILTVSEILNSFIEIVFFEKIKNVRFWEYAGNNRLRYKPLNKIKNRQKRIMDVLEEMYGRPSK